MRKKVAVVGGGIFGVTSAIKASSLADIDLYEELPDILSAASSINEYRLHRGYHYPRSITTVASSSMLSKEFREFYSQAVIGNREHYYAIAKENSLVTAKEYVHFCKKLDLEIEEARLDVIDNENISLLVKAKEHLFDPIILKRLCWEKLDRSRVNIFLKKRFTKELISNYDNVVIATYTSINDLLEKPEEKRMYQYEICEKPLVKLPKEFRNKSVVIMDGPFMCIDPYRNTSDTFVMGNVIHAIHASNIGIYPQIPSRFKKLINKGIITDPPITNFKKFIQSGSVFMPKIKGAKHLGSMFTIRTVLPNKESTDERPTIIKRVDKKIITIFSGKIASCISAGDEVLKIISY